MSTTTPNLGLVKPELTDAADITAMNQNWDKIDVALKDCIEIPANADLDNYTKVGKYFCGINARVSTLINCPTTIAFYLEVGKHAGVYQRLVEYNHATPKVFFRNKNDSGIWGDWHREYSTANKPTTEEIGALPITGGTLSGDVIVSKNGTPSVRVVNTSTSRRGTFQLDGQSAYLLNGDLNSTEYFGLSVDNAPDDLKDKLRFINKETTDNRATIYTVHGSHNKPSGTYKGNGSIGGHSIDTGGIGSVCVINGNYHTVLLSKFGGFYVKTSTTTGGSVGAINFLDAYFDNGTLNIESTHEALNKSGETYTYHVL